MPSSLFSAQVDVPTFHGDPQRTGWFAAETRLTPANVAGSEFGLVWSTEELDQHDHHGAHLYASPLYLDRAQLAAGKHQGVYSVVVAATTNSWVYAINAATRDGAAAGAILWRSHLCDPGGSTDGGVPLGVLSTPTIDLAAKRIYVVANGAGKGWEAFALNLADGSVLPGWPVQINNAAVSAPGVNGNGPSNMPSAAVVSQRGALNLSPDGSLLYVPFGGYGDGTPGWMAAVDTVTLKVTASFSGAASGAPSNGGFWASGGTAVDTHGNVYANTGNAPHGMNDTLGTWGQSLLMWPQPRNGFKLAGTYTPFNYVAADLADIDLGACAPVLIPDLDPATTSTPHLLTFGGKQGNIYLLDRDHLPGLLDRRPPPNGNSESDGSLLPPDKQPQFNARGPLNVFGPYSETKGNMDFARSRSTPACFRGGDGTAYVVATGTTKIAADSADNKPPCLARLKIVTAPGKPAYLAIDGLEQTVTFRNPGCPVVSSNGGKDAIIWVLDGSRRTASLTDQKTPHPILYAFDALSLKALWHSEALPLGGRYNSPIVARGVALVGTDRIYAFGLKGGAAQ